MSDFIVTENMLAGQACLTFADVLKREGCKPKLSQKFTKLGGLADEQMHVELPIDATLDDAILAGEALALRVCEVTKAPTFYRMELPPGCDAVRKTLPKRVSVRLVSVRVRRPEETYAAVVPADGEFHRFSRIDVLFKRAA